MTRPRRSLLIVGAALFLAVGCVNRQDPVGYLITPLDPEPTQELVAGVAITFVNGKRPPSQRIRLQPGEHVIRGLSRLDTPTRSSAPAELKITVQPCTEYELGARHSSRFNPNFEIVITDQRIEPGCEPDLSDAEGSIG